MERNFSRKRGSANVAQTSQELNQIRSGKNLKRQFGLLQGANPPSRSRSPRTNIDPKDSNQDAGTKFDKNHDFNEIIHKNNQKSHEDLQSILKSKGSTK